MKYQFSFLSLMIISALSSQMALASPSNNQFSSSATFAYFKHTNEGYRTSEKGWLPGLNLSFSHTSQQLRGTLASDIYIGDVLFSAENDTIKNINTTTSETFLRFFYLLENVKPTRFFQYYGLISLQRWNRDINSIGNITGINRKYEWWTIEAGVQANIVKSTKNQLQVVLGLTRSLFNEIQIDLRRQNLGKPLLKPTEEYGLTSGLQYIRYLKHQKGIKISANARYWRFGATTRNITIQGQTTEITEFASESLILTTNLTYFVQF